MRFLRTVTWRKAGFTKHFKAPYRLLAVEQARFFKNRLTKDYK